MFEAKGHAAIRRVGTVVAATAFAISLFGATAAAPAPTNAASTIGSYDPAYVACNYYYNTITMTPAAAAAPGLAQQTISYRYWILDRTLNRYVANWAPSGVGTFVHIYQKFVNGMLITTPGPVFGAATTITLVDGHSYSIYTEYWWPTNGAWYSAGTWTNDYQNEGSPTKLLKTRSVGACTL